MKTRFISKMTALVAAFVLVFSGATAFATTSAGSDGSGATSQKSEAPKCKKNKKKGKKCKAAAAPAPAAEPTGFVPGRVVELTYMGPAIGSADSPALNPWGLVAPVNFIPGMGETQALIEIVDDVSPNASAGFSYDSDGDGLNDTGIDVCGSTPEPIEVLPGTQYNVFPYLLPSTTCTDGVATSGTIKVTFNQI